jgi:hypothetical protein
MTELNFTLPQNLVLQLMDHDVKFMIVFVPPCPETDHTWLVNTYDARYDGTEYGIFISSYYLSTFLQGALDGINLDYSVPDWYLTSDAVKSIHHHILFHSNPDFYGKLITHSGKVALNKLTLSDNQMGIL